MTFVISKNEGKSTDFELYIILWKSLEAILQWSSNAAGHVSDCNMYVRHTVKSAIVWCT